VDYRECCYSAVVTSEDNQQFYTNIMDKIKYLIYNNGKPLRWESDDEVVVYGGYNSALEDFHPEQGDIIVPYVSDHETAMRYIDQRHGIEFDAGDVIYCHDGSVAEYDEDDCAWYIYEDAEAEQFFRAIQLPVDVPYLSRMNTVSYKSPKKI